MAAPEIYTIYIRVNNKGYIYDVNSCAQLSDTTGWIEIDKGSGRKYRFAHNLYFEKGLTAGNAYRYKYIDDEIVECTNNELLLQQHKYLFKMGDIENTWEPVLMDLSFYKTLIIEAKDAIISFYQAEDNTLVATFHATKCDLSNLTGNYYIHYDYLEEVTAVYIE